MGDVLATVVPLFGLIGLGFVAARFAVFPAEGGPGLARFVFEFAIPAMLFRTMVHVDEATASPFLLWLTYYGGLAISWAIASLLAPHLPTFGSRGRGVAGMAASFSNLVFLGLPLSLAAFGPRASLPAALMVAINAPILWFVGMLQMEWGGRAEGASIGRLVGDLVRSLLKNPIIIVLIAGSLWRTSGFGLPLALDHFLELLGSCSVPVALFSLGVSLSTYGLGGHWRAAAALAAIKLLVFPLMVALIGLMMPGLPPTWFAVAVLMAACPTGVNAFLLAMRYERAVPAVAATIAIGTAVSAFTLTVLLYWLRS